MKSTSVAIATSFSAIFNFLILNYFLKKKFDNIYEKEIFQKFFKIFITLMFAGISTLLIGYIFKDPSIYFILNKTCVFPHKFLDKLYSFFSLSTIYLTSTFLFAYLFKVKEILDFNIFKYIQRKYLK